MELLSFEHRKIINEKKGSESYQGCKLYDTYICVLI